MHKRRIGFRPSHLWDVTRSRLVVVSTEETILIGRISDVRSGGVSNFVVLKE